MKTTSMIRLDNLKLLVKEAGGVPELAKLMGYRQSSYLYQIKNQTIVQNGKAKNIGDNMAAKLERVMNKPKGWLDIPHQTTQIDNSKQTLNANGVGVQIGRDNYGDVSNIKMCETTNSCEDEQGFRAVKPLPLLDIDDAVEWLLNPNVRADKIKDVNERVATYIDHSDRTIGIKVHDNKLQEAFGIAKDDNLIIEPEIPPRDNDLVLVCLNCKSSPRGIVARLEMGLDNAYRLIYNKSAESGAMPPDSVICGVVVEVKRRLVNSEIVKSRRNPKWDIWQTLSEQS